MVIQSPFFSVSFGLGCYDVFEQNLLYLDWELDSVLYA